MIGSRSGEAIGAKEAETKARTTTKKSTQSIILLAILTALIVPVIYIYAYHGIHEIETSADAKEKGNETKYLRATSEGYFFIITAISYAVIIGFILWKPNKQLPYYILIFGTLAIIIMYYLRTTTGIPVLWTGVMIKEYLVDWNDVISKIGQYALIIPATILLMQARYKTKI